MIVIVRHGDGRLISCRQDIKAAWRRAYCLSYLTGISHWVGRL